MRTSLLMLMTAGCTGDAYLGAAPRLARLDAGGTRSDGGAARDAVIDVQTDSAEPLTVEVDVAPSVEQCNTCFDLRARSDSVRGDYTLEWEDGSSELVRNVCPTAPSTTYEVALRESATGRTAWGTRSLSPRSSTCADAGASPPTLCLNNGTFAVDPVRPPVSASALPASPWLACAKQLPNQRLPNRPQIVESSATIMGMPVLQATDGSTYLGLAEYEQASQALCTPIAAGQAISITLDAADVSGSIGPDVGLPRLEIWGGRAADCSQTERLWMSDQLSATFTSRCFTIRPNALIDSLTLRAASNAAAPFPGRVLVDHIQQVDDCP